MVQRDYVRKKSRPKKNNSRVMPSLMIIIALILVILFAAILYFVSTNNSNKPAETPKAKTEPPAVTLPEQPQERWTYLKELETPNSAGVSSNAVMTERQQILDSFANNTITAQTSTPTTVVPATTPTPQNPVTPPSTSQTSNKWLLQCGAFKEKSNADTLRAKLAMSGVNGNILTGQLYRVTAGPYNSKSDADKAVNSLKSNGVTNCIVTAK